MKVTLRQRKKNNKISLYLDYYHKGKRKTEYLRLYLTPNPKTKTEREVNKKTKQLAETICAQRQIEIQNGIYGFQDIEKLKGSFITYVTALAEKKNTSSGNYGNWNSMLKHLKTFCPTDVSFQDLDKSFVERFKEYLDKDAMARAGKKLSQNSKYSYFGKFNAALKQAVKDGILKVNPANGVEYFKQGEPQREFLTLDELQKALIEKEEIVNNAIYHNAFEWRFEFPEVLADDGSYIGFDAVIGNPPYLDMREISKKDFGYLKLNYITASNRVNLFSLFIERFYNISSVSAKSSFIVPRNLIRSNEYSTIRDFVLNKTSIKELLSFKLGVFEDVTSEVVILVLDKVFEKENKIKIFNFIKLIEKDILPKYINQSVFNESIGKRFNIYLTDEKILLLKKIESDSTKLGDISETLQGIIAGNEKKYISKQKETEIYMPILRGKNIDRFYTPSRAKEFIKYVEGTKVLTRSRKKENFEVDKKILTQHVSGKIKGTIDYSKFYYMQTINGTIIKDIDYQIEFILGILNSKLMNFYYDNTFNLGAEFTTAVAIHNIDLLPIKKAEKSIQDLINEKVTKTLTLKKENPEADTKLLESEIDQMVYDLYGLTEEEIKIVENR